jgi:cytochrome c peroxidase
VNAGIRAVRVAIALLFLAGCGGGRSSIPSMRTSDVGASAAAKAPPPPPPPPGRAPAPPSPTPSPVAGLSAASAAYLALDLTKLANYAHPALPASYDAQVRASDNTPPSNPVTDAGATLGRVLFNDKRLSTTGAISCASCHQQSIGFTDAAQLSQGVVAGSLTAKHAMRLGNVRYYAPGTMFWDKRAASVEAQVAGPITATVEMGYDTAHGGFATLTKTMAALPYYPELFRFVYGDTAITQTRIENALAQFERSMITTGSRWDAGYATVYNPAAPNKNLDADLLNFTAQENRGRHLFIAPPGQGGVGCAACHVPPTFALSANARSNGLDAGQTTVFKSPSLKNDARGPYMHDGRFATLAQVVDHYDHGVLAGPSLDPRLTRNGVPVQLHLSAADKAALVAFLSTLDDPAFFADPRFTNPFKK